PPALAQGGVQTERLSQGWNATPRASWWLQPSRSPAARPGRETPGPRQVTHRVGALRVRVNRLVLRPRDLPLPVNQMPTRSAATGQTSLQALARRRTRQV